MQVDPKYGIVSANGADINSLLWPESVSAPILYGVVLNPYHHSETEAIVTEEDEVYVAFVLSGEAEWVDKTQAWDLAFIYCELKEPSKMPPGIEFEYFRPSALNQNYFLAIYLLYRTL